MIGIVLQTGLALRFTAFLIDFTYGSLLPALLITMVAGVILGMGMPTTPAYIMQAALLVPAIMKLGVTPMAAHMFAFYFSCLSAVTPPVALAVYAAASIGGAGLWASGIQAMKFAAAGFIVPFFFVYNPALLFQGPWPEILRAVLTGAIGVIALAASLEGYCLRIATWWERAFFLAAAMLLIDPNAATDVVGAVLLACRPAAAEAVGSAIHCHAGGEHVTAAQSVALTLIAAALIFGTVVYGVLRIYGASSRDARDLENSWRISRRRKLRRNLSGPALATLQRRERRSGRHPTNNGNFSCLTNQSS